jgi:hypothetical protein
VLAHCSLPTKCTPWFTSIIEPYHGGFTIKCVYIVDFEQVPYMGWSTSKPCRYALTCDFVYPSCSIHPRECHLHSCQSLFGLEVSHQWKWLASTWNLIKVFPSKAFDEAVRKRELSDQSNMNGIIKVLCCTRTEEKGCLRDQKVFLSPTVSTSSFPHDQHLLHPFLCSPSFRKSQDEISFKGAGLWHPVLQNP